MTRRLYMVFGNILEKASLQMVRLSFDPDIPCDKMVISLHICVVNVPRALSMEYSKSL